MGVDDGGGGPAIISIMKSMVDFANAAAEGAFEITREGGDHLIEAIDDFQNWINDQSHRIGLLEQERKLGTSNGAKVIGPFTQQVASDERGFIIQLRALGNSLNKAREGIELAVRNYQATDEVARANLKNIST